MNKKKIITIALVAVLSVCAVFTGMMAYWQWNDQQQSKNDFNALAELITGENPASEQMPTPTDEPDERELAYEKYKALYEQNDDFVGWITIDGTAIDYPVMQSIGSPDFYLKHNFQKAYSDYGIPYVDEACAVGLSANTVIYGHHMKDGSMFSSLVKYADKSYFEEHPG